MTAKPLNTDRHDLITPAKFRTWDVGWNSKQIKAFFAGRSVLMVREIANDESIFHSDRMWVLTNALACKDIGLPYDFALWCAEHALAKLSPEWQAKLASVFDQVRALLALRYGTWDPARRPRAAATRDAWGVVDAAAADVARTARIVAADAMALAWVAAAVDVTQALAWVAAAAIAADAVACTAAAGTAAAGRAAGAAHAAAATSAFAVVVAARAAGRATDEAAAAFRAAARTLLLHMLEN